MTRKPSPLRQAVIGLGFLTMVLVGITLLAYNGAKSRTLRADVLSTRRAEPGELVAVTVSARDNFGTVSRVLVDFGDGHSADPVNVEPGANCRSEFARTESFDFEHAYERRGVFTVRSRVRTEGCGAAPEERTAIRTIDVKPLRRS